VLLAAIGTYGVVSFSAAERMYEMGVRIALGATRRDVFGLVLKLSLRLVLIGLGIGVMLAVAATWTLSSFLYGVSSRDPLTLPRDIVVTGWCGRCGGFRSSAPRSAG